MRSPSIINCILIAFSLPLWAAEPGSLVGSKFKYINGERSVTYSLPKDYRPDGNSPLVLFLTWDADGTPEFAQVISEVLRTKAIEKRALLAFLPSGQGLWDTSFPDAKLEKDEDAVLAAIDHLKASLKPDETRIYLVGFSNPGVMTHLFAARHPSKITAAASFLASLESSWSGKLKETNAVPMFMCNGDSDPIIPWSGGGGELPGGVKTGPFFPVMEAAKYWQKRNGAREYPNVTKLNDIDQTDGSKVERYDYPGKAPVVLLKVLNGGHAAPTLKDMPELKPNRDIESIHLAWDLLFQFQKSNR